jgi:hypothetical protein
MCGVVPKLVWFQGAHPWKPTPKFFLLAVMHSLSCILGTCPCAICKYVDGSCDVTWICRCPLVETPLAVLGWVCHPMWILLTTPGGSVCLQPHPRTVMGVFVHEW